MQPLRGSVVVRPGAIGRVRTCGRVWCARAEACACMQMKAVQ
jgi:hypothetical protein